MNLVLLFDSQLKHWKFIDLIQSIANGTMFTKSAPRLILLIYFPSSNTAKALVINRKWFSKDTFFKNTAQICVSLSLHCFPFTSHFVNKKFRAKTPSSLSANLIVVLICLLVFSLTLLETFHFWGIKTEVDSCLFLFMPLHPKHSL